MESSKYKRLAVFCCLCFAAAAGTAEAQVVSKNIKIECADKFQIDGVIDLPQGKTAQEIRRVIVLVPGSGAHGMDVDLTVVSRDKSKKNLVFKTIGNALASSGFAVIRYNKRNYQLRQMLKQDATSPDVKKFRASLMANPLKLFVDDVLSISKLARKRFPNANVYLLGHSEGTYVSLQAARQLDSILGVGLIGFAEYSTDRLAFEQTVYRPLYGFRDLDKNSDNQLEKQELEVGSQFANGLKMAFNVVDQDKDGKITESEFKAVNYANMLVQDIFAPFRKQEAAYPRVAEILKTAKFKVAFFQGMLDNQTPAYHAQAFELLLTQLGKAGKMQFHYFKGLGHALDARENYQDVQYSTIDPDALNKLVSTLDKFFTAKSN